MEPTETSTPEVKLELERDALLNLHETGGWASFLAILGFILVGFLILMGFIMNTVFSNLPVEDSPLPITGTLFMVVYLLIAIVYFFPVYFLYKFASGVRQGIRARDSHQVGEAIRYLNSHYKFIGIMTIAMFVLYFVFILLFFALGAGKMLGDSVNA